MSHSENKPKTTQTSNTTVSNLNVQDVEGVTFANSDNNTYTSTVTDFGAIDAATDLAGRGLDSAMSFGRDSIAAVEKIAGDSIARANDNLSEGFDFGRSAIEFAGDQSGD